MTTKAESNRRNALRSTGPKTMAGKAKVSRNAVRHGAYAEALSLLLEDPENFETLRRGLVEGLRPVGPLEAGMVDRMASLWWRMDRAKLVANQSLWMQYREGFMAAVRHEANEIKWNKESPSGEILRPFLEAKQEDADECRLTSAWNQDTQDRLLRHELSLERSFFRTLHELERLQARREGFPVPPPLTVDLNITGIQD